MDGCAVDFGKNGFGLKKIRSFDCLMPIELFVLLSCATGRCGQGFSNVGLVKTVSAEVSQHGTPDSVVHFSGNPLSSQSFSTSDVTRPIGSMGLVYLTIHLVDVFMVQI